ncbi:hypothetical protein WA026_013738 [Henosepilachna vigintioctopunctata]|uniref:Coiled-coil domain-containing protein 167 n=1 Tax=Henosepilachna vigintioctopunctata TaxID=420089 RepID=A0AAW1UYE6_9CUCU
MNNMKVANVGCSMMKEISKTEAAIKETLERACKIEEQLKQKKIPPEQQKLMELELQEVKKLLLTNKEILKNLHKHNIGNFFIAGALLLLGLAFFILFQCMRDNF